MTTKERVNQLCDIHVAFKKYSMYDFMKFCSVGEFEIIAKTRTQEIRMNRQLAGVFGFSHGMSLQKIGEELGGIDHATVLHGIRVVYDDFFYGKHMKQYLEIFHKNIDGHLYGFSLDMSTALLSLEHKIKQTQCIN
jgi:hypothetical protein